jgi:sugar/nucleoside kinase (ribokinase family)
VYRGASKNLDTKELPRSFKSRWLYATSFGGDARFLKAVFEKVERKKVKVAWNPGERELQLGLKKLTPHLRTTDVLILNREEAALLCGKPASDMRGLIKALKDLPRQALAITDGQKGAYLCAEGKTWFAPSLKAKRINTTGAGDAFGSALVTGLIHQLSPQDALRLAMLNATSVVSHMGAKTGVLQKMPTERDLKRVSVRPVVIPVKTGIQLQSI